MNINFERALKDIDAQKFDSAVEELHAAITFEQEHGRPDDAEKYRCVLAELFANIGRFEESKEEFTKVLVYSKGKSELAAQQKIAQTFLDRFENAEKRPLVNAVKTVKPKQDRAFIASKTRKRK